MMAKRYLCSTLFLLLAGVILPVAASGETFVATHTPWSGYWWPWRSGGLITGMGYYGAPAPIHKYDLLTRFTYPAELTTFYQANYYDPGAPSWYGHCGSWALAAISERYGIMPSSEDNIIFRVGDKKGLLTIAHEKDLVELADGSDPAVFHYWLLYYLKERGLAFVADLDPGEEKWNYPIFQVDLTSSRFGNTENVTATFAFASDNVHPDYIGTRMMLRTYTYTLQLDGSGGIVGGSWTGTSIADHPDRLMFPRAYQPLSPLLDYQEVRRLAQSRDDYLEAGVAPVELPPGTYNLTLLDPDVYEIACNAGDTVKLTVEKVIGSSLPMQAVVSDGAGAEVGSFQFDRPGQQSWQFVADNPPYTLTLSQTDYAVPNIYSLIIDLEKTATYNFPFIPKNGMWSGFALTNPGNEPVEQVMLTTTDRNGVPLHTVFGPLTLAPGEKRVLLFANLPWRRHELAQTTGLTLRASAGIATLNLYGSTNQLATQVQQDPPAATLIIPETIPDMDLYRSFTGSLINRAFAETTVEIATYTSSGLRLSSRTTNLASRGVQSLQPGFAPLYSTPDDGWLQFRSLTGDALSAYYYLNSPDQAEGMFALIADEEAKVIPHVPPPGNWYTTLTLINPNDSSNRLVLHPVKAGADRSRDLVVTLNPYEKKSLTLQNRFGFLPSDPLYHSVIEVYGERKFAGFFLYQATSATDKAKYPLVSTSRLARELVMPHYPGTAGYWWTGMGVYNPMSIARTVEVLPYDKQGRAMTEAAKTLSLAGGEYAIFTVQALFGDRSPDISFVKCRATGAGDVIGGFYLYGGNGARMLSGTLM